MDFPGGSEGKDSARNVWDQGSIPGLRRSSGEGNGNPLDSWVGKITGERLGYALHYSGLENSPQGHKESDMTEQLSFSPVFLPGESHGQRSLAGYSP